MILKGRAHRFGDDINTDYIISSKYKAQTLRIEDAAKHLMEDIDPGFADRIAPGDIIVAGRNFGMGPKMNGYIAMQAMGLGLVCESMPFLAYRACIGVGLRTLADCPAVTGLCDTGDELEVDFSTGLFINRTRGITREYPPLPETLRELVRLGGNAGWLKNWWESRQQGAGTRS